MCRRLVGGRLALAFWYGRLAASLWARVGGSGSPVNARMARDLELDAARELCLAMGWAP
jgi:hypothetical protein